MVLITAVVFLFAFSVSAPKYKDGTFTGESKSKYTSEPYFGQTTITIKDGRIQHISFQIIDKEKNEVFDEKYEKHYKGYEVYVQQCRNDWKGVQAYNKLIEKRKSIDKVDAISGATWSYNLLKDSYTEALKKAEFKN